MLLSDQARLAVYCLSMSADSAVTPLDKLPVTILSGVGPKVAGRLIGLDIHTVQDVLFHLPFRYQDRTRLASIGSLKSGDEAVIEVELLNADVVMRRRRSLLCSVTDGTGIMTLRFFHFSKAQLANLQPGLRLQCFGEVRMGPNGFELVHPEYKPVEQSAILQASLTPIYPSAEGVHQLTLRRLTEQALELLAQPGALNDWLDVSKHDFQFELPDLASALQLVHRPPPDADVAALIDGTHPAHQRLAFEELVAHRLGLRQSRSEIQSHGAHAIAPAGALLTKLIDSQPYRLTGAQARVLTEVREDLSQPRPMLRLVQGDVGAGKTIVAAGAAALAVEAGFQVAVMAPTEILAEQHLLNFSEWFDPLGVNVGWLSGKLGQRARRDALAAIDAGHSQIVIGTHALFQQDVEFPGLGLTIIDEQHRFGVHQRLSLRNKGADGDRLPHQLIMTATPIPRTLAMTAYADLACSVIDELPPGRQPVKTVAVENSRREEIVERVDAAIGRGRQVYWVCTLIEESDVLEAEAAGDTAELLQAAMPSRRISLVHGRMKAREKEQVMAAFKAAEIDLLVATTVIEVGVDVPNASLMVIENAERLGLSQLHQLRGRVGRGTEQSSCLLVYQAPLSNQARQRIAIMRETSDGFEIANRDLELRGAGELLGTRQTGLAEFRIADLSRDAGLLNQVVETADRLLEADPQAVRALLERWIGDSRRAYGMA